MGNELEFDRALTRELSQLELEQIPVRETTPWRRAMGYLLWGLGLTCITVNFFGLQYILPTLGALLLVLGFRPLRRENRYFRLAWLASLIRLSGCGAVLVWKSTLLSETVGSRGLSAVGLVLICLQLLQQYCLWQGLLGVKRRAGGSSSALPAAALLLWTVLILVLGLAGAGDWPVALAMLAAYLCILYSLWRLAGLLDEAGYVLRAAPVRLSDGRMAACWGAGLLIFITIGIFFFSNYPMDWTAVEEGEQAGLEDLRASLLELGCPDYVLDDLTAEELSGLEGAFRVEVEIDDYPMNSGRQVSTTVGSHTHTSTVYDVEELRITTVAVKIQPNEGGDPYWRVIHHFLWQVDPELRGTECIKLWTVWKGKTGGFLPYGYSDQKLDGCPAGRVLYDGEDGRTYAASYYSLGLESSQSTLFSPSWEQDIVAAYSMPSRGSRIRGYVAYSAKQNTHETYLFDAWINYTHQDSRFLFPMTSAREFSLSGSWNQEDFPTVQTALQFYSKWED